MAVISSKCIIKQPNMDFNYYTISIRQKSGNVSQTNITLTYSDGQNKLSTNFTWSQLQYGQQITSIAGPIYITLANSNAQLNVDEGDARIELSGTPTSYRFAVVSISSDTIISVG